MAHNHIDMTGKVVVITGGSRGLGAGIELKAVQRYGADITDMLGFQQQCTPDLRVRVGRLHGFIIRPWRTWRRKLRPGI